MKKKMSEEEFFNIYKSLSSEQKDELNEIVEEIQDRERSLSDLSEKLENLSPSAREELEKECEEFKSEADSDLEGIEDASFIGRDPEESGENQSIAIIDHNAKVRETLITEYPEGVEILKNEIEELEDKALRLIRNSRNFI